MLKATTTTVIYTKRPSELKAGIIHLSDHLTMDLMWCDVHVTGPKSIIEPGDEILMSRRPVSYEFIEKGVKMYNTSDASCVAFKHNGILKATCGTILYEWIEDKEEVTESGIIVVQKASNKELEPKWAKVIAAGPDSGVNPGDEVLLAFKNSAYNIKIDDKKFHNAGKEEIIAYRETSVSISYK